MSSYCVIGSGISGATIANLLSKKNSVHVYDKARGPGGRSSFKRLNKTKGFDHGAQYISPKTIQFKKFITNLCKKKILKKWNGKHIFLNKLKKENKNHVKIIGHKGNNDISKHLIKNINCNFQSELEKIKYTQNQWKLDTPVVLNAIQLERMISFTKDIYKKRINGEIGDRRKRMQIALSKLKVTNIQQVLSGPGEKTLFYSGKY